MDEQWRDAVGFEGLYLVSSLGRVRRIQPRIRGRKSDDPSGILRANPQTNGYMRVTLFVEGKQLTRLVHRLIAHAFLGAPAPRQQVNHKNGDKANNTVANLEWATPRENRLHAFRVLKHQLPKGEAHANSKLNDQKVREIREHRRRGVPTKLLCKRYGVSESVLVKAATGKTWKHVV
jgi:hypothetical protein